jgi:hypothetical protein
MILIVILCFITKITSITIACILKSYFVPWDVLSTFQAFGPLNPYVNQWTECLCPTKIQMSGT